MDIESPLRELGSVDASALVESILAQGHDAWREELHRQKSYDVHRETESIVMVFIELDDWPNIIIKKEPGWDRLVDVAMPVMHDIIGRFYPAGGTIIRAMAAKLLAGGKIASHRDSHPSFHRGHRIHVPITTNSRVRFIIDGRPYRFQVGQAYEINNQKIHSVMNKGTEDRITFIFDYIPPDEMAKIQRGGRSSQVAYILSGAGAGLGRTLCLRYDGQVVGVADRRAVFFNPYNTSLSQRKLSTFHVDCHVATRFLPHANTRNPQAAIPVQ